MKGMELSRRYYEEYGKKMIETKFYKYKNNIAVGLVGEGSQCFEFDDEYSKDHDFGVGFCMWLTRDLYNEIGLELRKEYNNLPQSFMGYSNDNIIAQDRNGVFEIESFYHKYTNCGSRPKDVIDWMKIPERFLSTATNGKVFVDDYGAFSSARQNLLNFYPSDVLRKKLASKTAIMAQSGQYNYMRAVKRSDFQSAYFACNEFIKTALSAIFLLNRVYMPFYKWAFRASKDLTLLKDAINSLGELALIPDNSQTSMKKFEIIEYICYEVSKELRKQGFCASTSDFLESYAVELMQGIEDSRIKNLHIMADFD